MYPTSWNYLGFDAVDTPGYDLIGRHFGDVCQVLDTARDNHQKVHER